MSDSRVGSISNGVSKSTDKISKPSKQLNDVDSEISHSNEPLVERNCVPLTDRFMSSFSILSHGCNEKINDSDDTTDYKSLWIEFIGGQSEVDSMNLSEEDIQRQVTIYKMIETEKNYVSDILIIIQYYINPMRENNLLNKKDLSALFSNLEQIYGLNKCEYLKMYILYCSNYTFAITKLEELKNSKSIAKFLNTQSTKEETKSLSLECLLIKPVQRITMYPEYIKNIIKYTDKSHKEYNNLIELSTKLDMVVKIVRDNSLAAESFYKLVVFQSRFSPKINILSPLRKLKYKCEVDIYMKKATAPTHLLLEALSNKKTIEKQKRMLFIFNDLIIIAKSLSDEPDRLEKGKLKLIQKREYSDVEVRNIKNSSIKNCSKGNKNTSSNSVLISNEFMHSIEITFYNPEVLFIVFCDSEESKSKILAYLTSYIRGYHEHMNKNESEPNIIKSLPAEKVYSLVNGMEDLKSEEERSPSPVKSAKSTQSMSSKSMLLSSGSIFSSKSENI
ncbi:Dbl homology domain-containing protein [Neocallimastix californiae]|uniref:Dbl homology domain-containing protein n=1 Tax=Neocallimastix californiae TaxID=1754190 RepID=A0A1Y2AIL2_9FUNG|nr:Dbl homology domain-containing protein [Neocallimastix californiae]|eukprot:ORY22366.1 Dbl homology domain-containing protein [Neocallimastix californiae]